jgi:long-chain acyl-CoA synthetase
LTQTHDSQPARLGDIPRRWARETPARTALWQRAEPVSFGELAAAVAAAREVLAQNAVRPGDRVMIVAENSLAEVAFLFAASEQGAWPVLINARLSAREVESIRAHCRPRVRVFAGAESADAAVHARECGAAEVTLASLGRVALSEVDRSTPAEEGTRAGEVAALIYTSGTTGAPKGVMLTHAGLLHFCRISAALRRIVPADVVYGALPLSHIFGFVTILLSSLYGGASVYLEPRFTPAAACAALTEHGISLLQGVPTLFTRLLGYLAERGQAADFPRLRYLYIGGGALDLTLKARIEAVFGLPAHHGYGMTEYAGSMAVTRIERPRRDASCGELNPGCEIRILGADGPLPPGQTGAIEVRGPGTMLGYYRDPELTREVLRPEGWLATGDLGRIEADGQLFVVGRGRDLIKRAGFSVYPIEIETELHSHPGVKLAAVVGWPGAGGEERIVAFVEPRAGALLDPEELLEYAAGRLAPYKRPARVIIVESLPLTANGKIRKAELRAGLDR